MAEGSLETSQEQESSFADYFRVLRAEVADFLSARKPRVSGHVRILSEPHTDLQRLVAELEIENERLRQRVTALELHNSQLQAELREEYVLQYSEKLSQSLSRCHKHSPEVRICEVIEEPVLEESWPEDTSTVQGNVYADEGSICLAGKAASGLSTLKMDLSRIPSQGFELSKQELRRPSAPPRPNPVERMLTQVVTLQREVRKHKDFIKQLRTALETLAVLRSQEREENRKLKAEVQRLCPVASV